MRSSPARSTASTRYSGGVPRVINLLCDRALMAGAKRRRRRSTPEFIDAAAARLDVAMPRSKAEPRWKHWRLLALVTAAVLLAIGAIAFLAPLYRSVDVTLPPMPPGSRPPVAQPISALPVPDVVIPIPRNLLLTPGLF